MEARVKHLELIIIDQQKEIMQLREEISVYENREFRNKKNATRLNNGIDD